MAAGSGLKCHMCDKIIEEGEVVIDDDPFGIICEDCEQLYDAQMPLEEM